jgi:hypothetical protein
MIMRPCPFLAIHWLVHHLGHRQARPRFGSRRTSSARASPPTAESARIEPLLSTVTRGLDPGLDPRTHLFAKRMDCRVKLGNDNRFNMTGNRNSTAFPRFESYQRINQPRPDEERARHPEARVPTWGARLEGLRASRRTTTSETKPAAILRDGASRLLRRESAKPHPERLTQKVEKAGNLRKSG